MVAQVGPDYIFHELESNLGKVKSVFGNVWW